MALPKIGKSDRGVLDGIKSRLGFSGSQAVDDYDEGYYEDSEMGYEDYGADYGPNGYSEEYQDDSYGRYAPASTGNSSYEDSRNGQSGPRLVSIDDVRARTQVPDSLNRNPLPERRTAPAQNASKQGYRSSYNRPSRTIEHAADYMLSTDIDTNPIEHQPRSTGYDSLFSSTSTSSSASSSNASGAQGAARSYDPYETYAGSGPTSHNPSRSLSVLKPASYDEVERIAKIVKAGDVVVLSLKNTPENLVKRILDFSFGVSSALDASVECIADKVFVIIRGRELNEEEKTYLRNQGVL